MKKKIASTPKKNPNSALILGGLVILVILVGLLIKRMFTSPQVALIAESTASMCTTNITTISFQDECANTGTFRRAVYTCSNGSTAEKLASGENCIAYSDIVTEAQKNCGQTCNGPSPIPSCVPNPCPAGAACKLMALPSGQVYCPVSTPSPVPPTSPSPTPTPKPSIAPTPISTSYPSVAPSAPPACKAQEVTHYAFREICPVPAGATEQYRYIDYTCGDETVPRTMGSSDTCQFYTSLKSGAEFYCRRNACTVTVSTPTPMPSPIYSTKPSPAPSLVAAPTPTITPRSVTKQTFGQCYSMCRAKRVGVWGCVRSCTR